MSIERLRVSTLGLIVVQMTALVLSLFSEFSVAQSASSDAAAMQELKVSLKLNAKIDWSDSDPCKWAGVGCDTNNRVTRIQVKDQGISGTISPSIANLTNLEDLELMGNSLTGPLPSLKGFKSLQTIYLHGNKFSSIPDDFFDGMTSLQEVFLDHNPFKPWSIPKGLKDSSSLMNFSAVSTNVGDTIPDIFSPDNFPGLMALHLSFNNITGGFPSTFSGLGLQSLWVNGQLFNGARSFNGTIEVLQNMTQLVEIWLNMNALNGPIPDLSKLTNLKDLNLRDNSLSGPVPISVINLPSLKTVNLTNNGLQGPTPKFPKSVDADIIPDMNCFCSSDPEVKCDSRVSALISAMEPFGYPLHMARAWRGNDPCAGWMGITCFDKNITIINLQDRGLVGTLSPNFSVLTSVQALRLSHNNITGTIPEELTRMPNLRTLDLSFNNLHGKVPSFPNTRVNVEGNANIDKDPPPSPPGEPVSPPGQPPSPPGQPVSPPGEPPSPPGEPVSPPGEPPRPPGEPGRSPREPDTSGKSSDVRVIVGSVIGAFLFISIASMLIYFFLRKNRLRKRGQQSKPMVIHPNNSESDDSAKITLTGPGVNGKAVSEEQSQWSSGPTDVHVIEANNMSISIQVLRNVTNDFSNKKILGRGGFGTVYKGELPDGTEIAVKRMNSGVLGDKGLAEFESEIAVLTKVRHRHLVGLLGFCLDGNEKLLVYEHLPQGPLSRYLFSWKEEGLKPLQWSQRLTIALDVARGVEYLHGLAQQSFIHRDLKPSNILLGDDLRAKVADFGLVRLAPDGGKTSIQTRLAGTFGYLAPEYAVMGRITTKVDVFSFGVILMEMITGRKALDESQPEESVHLVTWFRRICINKDSFQKGIDPTIDLDEETLASVNTVTQLAGYCCAREPSQRPDMSHLVTVLSSLVDDWKPTEDTSEDLFDMVLEMTLPQALKNWQNLGDSNIDASSSSSFLTSGDNTQTSIPTRPSGFAESFTSTDAR